MVDAPLFERVDETDDVSVGGGGSTWTAVHHAFTSPMPEHLATFDTDPGSALAYAYDIVCNGNEIGGGSIRIHRADIQQRVFAVMGLTDEQARRSSASCSTRSRSARRRTAGSRSAGTGSCMLLAGADSIREVIAFPKSGGGYDPLTGAPAPITAAAAQGGGRRRRRRRSVAWRRVANRIWLSVRPG